MEIVYRKLSELKPNPKNPRKSTKEAIEKLARSISENPKFFEARPILLSDRTGQLVIIGGERRSEAAALLKMETVPTILMSGLTEAQEDEILIKDNTHAGVWDEQKLQAWGKDQLQSWNVDGVKWPKEPIQAKEDNFDPDKKVKSRVKRGDIWQLGRHRLLCGDSTKKADVERLMGGGKADIAFASPPYNAGFGANLTKNNGRDSKYQNGDDNKKRNEYTDFLNAYISNASEFSEYNFCNIQMLANNKLSIFDMINANIDRLGDIIIWDKTHSQPQLAANVLNSEFEFVFCFHKRGNRSIGSIPFHGTLANIVHIAPCHNDYAKVHNAVFPIALPAHFINNFAKKSVLDLFGGTGSTLIAAEQTNRTCYTMEIDPHYCDVIIDRWEQFTGKKAKKLTTA